VNKKGNPVNILHTAAMTDLTWCDLCASTTLL